MNNWIYPLLLSIILPLSLLLALLLLFNLLMGIVNEPKWKIVHDRWLEEIDEYERLLPAIVEINELNVAIFNNTLLRNNIKNVKLVFYIESNYNVYGFYFLFVNDIMVKEILPNDGIITFEMPSQYMTSEKVETITKLFKDSNFYYSFRELKVLKHKKDIFENRLSVVENLNNNDGDDIFAENSSGVLYAPLFEESDFPKEKEIGKAYELFKLQVIGAKKVAFDEKAAELFSGKTLDIDIIDNWQNYLNEVDDE